MLSWIAAHIVDLVLIALIVLACFFVIRRMIRDRRAGKSCCGDCTGCAGRKGCAADKRHKEEGRTPQ